MRRIIGLTAFLLVGRAAGGAAIENAHLRLAFDPGRPTTPLTLVNKLAGGTLTLRSQAPELQFEGTTFGGMEPTEIEAREDEAASRVVLSYPPQSLGEVRILVRTIFEVGADSPVLRKRVAFTCEGPAEATPLLKRVVLLDEPFDEAISFQMTGWQSYPVFGEQFFLGVAFPVAQSTVADGRARLSHAPGRTIPVPGEFRSHDAVIGVGPKDRVREAFEAYVASFRPIADTVHFNYNSWWTSPVPFSEADILGLIAEFDEKLFKRHGVSFDTFTIDMGWSDPQGIWKVGEKLFPNGFAPLTAALAGQKARLGLWWSPSNCYSPSSFDNNWAAAQGYETFSLPRPNGPPMVLACLGRGTRYQREAAENLGRIVRESGLGQMKFDGYLSECPVNAHGHQPGELSREAIADGMIGVFKALRRASPDLWMETTCFGYDASPWWLEHATSVIGPFGDDAPYGAVPAPVYRESYTTSRDFYNLHGSVTPVPIAAQEVLGIIHQSDEPMYNDAVTTVLRGHEFISLYINPKFMADRDYAFLADLMRWTRANAPMLARTRVIWPETWRKNGPAPVGDLKAMPRESYGYAHWRDGQGLLCVRNPWIAMDEVEITLGEPTFGIPESATGTFAAVQIYPRRLCLAGGLAPGGELRLRMQPYEAKVIRIVPDQTELRAADEPAGAAAAGVELDRVTSRLVERQAASPATQPFGDDYTVLSRSDAKFWEARIEGKADRDGMLYWLVESPEPPPYGREHELTVNGTPSSPRIGDSEAGWAAAQPHGKQTSWTWYIVSLPAGDWTAAARIEASTDAKVSAWIVTDHGDADSADPAVDSIVGSPAMPLPPVYRPSVCVQAIGLTAARELPTEQRTEQAKVERINGIYLDRLEPASAAQGWGELRRNCSVWERPIRIGTRRFARGLGTHANSRIVYQLDGRYQRLHGFAGQDLAVNGSVVMEIHADGRRVWESGRMTRGDEPKPFTIRVGGVRELALVVTDGGDTFMGDHADWADVWLESE